MSEEERELHRKRIIEGKKNSPMSLESRQKLSKALKGLQVGSKNPMYGKFLQLAKPFQLTVLSMIQLKSAQMP